MDLKDKKILLTGASGGIGSTLALALEKEGAELFLVSYSEEETSNLNSHLKKAHKHYYVDLTKDSQIKKLVKDIKKDAPDLDILINNAGIGVYKSLEDISPEEWSFAMKLNLNAPFLLSKYLLEAMNPKAALIMNIGSGAGVIPMKDRVSYNATKFGLRGMSLSLAKEYEGTYLEVVLITLGSVLSSFGGITLEEKQKKNAEDGAYLTTDFVTEKLIAIMKKGDRAPEYEFYPPDYWPLSAKKQTHLLFRELLQELDALKWPKDSYAITSSGALAVRGLRRAHDLDIIVLPEFWEKLSKKYDVNTEIYPHINIGNIEVFGPTSTFINPPMPPVEEQIATADVIDGHRFVALATVEKAKKMLHRGKDYKDVADIERIVKETQVIPQEEIDSITSII